MTFDLGMPMVPEVALFVLAVLVLFIGLMQRPAPHATVEPGTPGSRIPDPGSRSASTVGWVTLIGLLATFGLTFLAREDQSLFGGSFVNDTLAIFSKKLFVGAAALSVLASLTLRQGSFVRRAAEYHFVLIASVLGMLVLASARELILLFVAFELMSIPLYFLTGFQKGQDTAPEGALIRAPGWLITQIRPPNRLLFSAPRITCPTPQSRTHTQSCMAHHRSLVV